MIRGSGAGESAYHVPALVEQTMDLLAPSSGETAVDVTVGGGGHARLILEAISPGGILIGIDRDPDAIEEASGSLGWAGDRVKLRRARMSDVASVLAELGISGADAMLADLGVSSHQLGQPRRGFSIRRDGPLDMRMDQDRGETAAELIAASSAEELERVFRDYGEERYARRIAGAIAGRDDLQTTAKLAAAVAGSVPRKGRQRIHPATRVFQALRIAVNDELGELERFLESAPDLLKPGGRLAVISYHSLEDRMVKRRFRELSSGEGFDLLTRKAVRPKDDEVSRNPRARSARLRALRRAG